MPALVIGRGQRFAAYPRCSTDLSTVGREVIEAMHVCVVIASMFLVGASPELAAVRAYVGKHAVDVVGGSEGFFQVPYVARNLQRLLNRNEARVLNALGVLSVVEQEDGFIFTTACRPHDCPSEHAVVAIDDRTGATYVAFWHSKRGAMWVGPAGRTRAAPAALPCAVLEAFHFGHVPRISSADTWCKRAEREVK